VTRILVVEDEDAIAEPLSYMLRKEGYEVGVVTSGPAALAAAGRSAPDLILLDLMLPGMPGTDVCRELRARSSVPIIMVTARDSELDKVLGLEIGADDYVTKPFSARELMARIRAVLRRRSDADDVSSPVEAGPVRIDSQRHEVRVRGELITLPLKEFELLEHLVRHEGRVLTRAQLIERIWGADYVGDTKTLDVHVKRLRAKVEPDPSHPNHLLTVRGLGYKFVG
jgi:two-component system response regulator RegX3